MLPFFPAPRGIETPLRESAQSRSLTSPAVSPRRSSGTYPAMAERQNGEEPADDVVSEPQRPADTTEETVTRGRASGTPFVLLGGVALVIWSIVAIVAAVLLLVWWLA